MEYNEWKEQLDSEVLKRGHQPGTLTDRYWESMHCFGYTPSEAADIGVRRAMSLVEVEQEHARRASDAGQ